MHVFFLVFVMWCFGLDDILYIIFVRCFVILCAVFIIRFLIFVILQTEVDIFLLSAGTLCLVTRTGSLSAESHSSGEPLAFVFVFRGGFISAVVYWRIVCIAFAIFHCTFQTLKNKSCAG